MPGHAESEPYPTEREMETYDYYPDTCLFIFSCYRRSAESAGKTPAIAPGANPPADAHAPGANERGNVVAPAADQRQAQAPAGVEHEGVVGDEPNNEMPAWVGQDKADGLIERHRRLLQSLYSMSTAERHLAVAAIRNDPSQGQQLLRELQLATNRAYERGDKEDDEWLSIAELVGGSLNPVPTEGSGPEVVRPTTPAQLADLLVVKIGDSRARASEYMRAVSDPAARDLLLAARRELKSGISTRLERIELLLGSTKPADVAESAQLRDELSTMRYLFIESARDIEGWKDEEFRQLLLLDSQCQATTDPSVRMEDLTEFQTAPTDLTQSIIAVTEGTRAELVSIRDLLRIVRSRPLTEEIVTGMIEDLDTWLIPARSIGQESQ